MSAISTNAGPRPAIERAAIAWGAAHGDRLHEQEQRRHERLIQATRRIESKPVETSTSRFQQGDRYHWRRGARAHGVITGTCRKCLGKGWVTVSDGTGCIDIEACHHCQRSFCMRPADDVSVF